MGVYASLEGRQGLNLQYRFFKNNLFSLCYVTY